MNTGIGGVGGGIGVGGHEVKGSYDAATNTPDLDSSPITVVKGDAYTVSVAGLFFTEAVEQGDLLIADQDSPTLLTHWTRVNKNISFGTAAGTAAEGNDPRLSDARPPTAHAASHAQGGSDELDVANLGSASAAGANLVPSSDGSGGVDWSTPTVGAHAADHQNGGSDEVNVAGLSGLLADAQTPAAHAAAHQDGGADEISVAGLSGLLADDQNPTAHASDHQHGGSDEIATATPAANAIPKATAGSVLADGFISESSITQHEAAIDHDALTGFEVGEHRVINDAGTSTIELWSANKIDAEFSAVFAGVDIKPGVSTSTTGLGNIALSGEQTLNGVTTSASPVLVTEQTLGEDNGPYISAAGAWARAPESDTDAEVTNGNIVHVLDAASTKFKYKYLLVTPDPIVVGTTVQTWEEHRDIDFGTTSGTAAEGDDSRILSQDENDAAQGTDSTPSTSNRYVTNSDSRNTNARTPTAHASDHQNGGSDEIATATPAINSIPKSGGAANLDSWVSPASETVQGKIELATQAEVDAGTETALAVTPATLAGRPLSNDVATATADTTTTSTTDVLVNSMTLTPASGTYLVWFSGSVDHGTTNATIEASIYAAGVQDADSERRFTRGGSQGAVTSPFGCVGKVTVNGAQAIEGQWRTSSGTATMHERNLTILKVA